MTILSVHGITQRFSGLTALNQVSFEVDEGSVVGLIGPNGAGKSTLFSIVAGDRRPTSGQVKLDGADITGWRPHRTAAAGVARTFQLTRPFGSMTVLDNVITAAHLRHSRPRDARQAAGRICAQVGLGDIAHQRADTLTAASRKRLELGRALATRPRLLLLDEALSGLTPTEALEAADVIREINTGGLTIVMVEHVMDLVMALCHRVVVLDFGEKIFDGVPSDAITDQAVVDAYLGDVTNA